MAVQPVSLRFERRLLREGAGFVAGMDEVGRGALSGPVSIGVVVIDASTRTAPRGIRDSKELSAAVREHLVPRIRRWAVATSVGHASAAEVDEVGIVAALGLAGRRALANLPVAPQVVILDGPHDYVTPAYAHPARMHGNVDRREEPHPHPPVVRPVVKGDSTCASVAAASIVAKCTRDAIMVDLDALHPEYGWLRNKGYASADHRAALARFGSTSLHRRTWRLPVRGN